ncbi:unnamed protein product [Moneuplotes crassus]|uniref:Uncharacterized protein n=1 Tax=Euplotes crassus TaxID=5936 RepID=A0AAD1Y5L9_EUPCR|nr:unnamed protein product [Moneuplotes crassus]
MLLITISITKTLLFLHKNYVLRFPKYLRNPEIVENYHFLLLRIFSCYTPFA